MLTLGQREKRHTINCLVCGQDKLVHRAGALTCSTRCRVAWHRLTPTEQQEVLHNRRMADEIAGIR